MANPTYTAIREALKGVFATITATAGYTTTLRAENFRNVYDPNAQAKEEAVKYPKLFFLIDEGNVQNLVGGRVRRDLFFFVICVTLQDKKVNTVEPSDQITNLIEDVEQALMRNYTLGGLANSVQLRNFKMDSGTAYPEGSAVLEIIVNFDKTY